MTIQINFKCVDSITINLWPVKKEKYDNFILHFCNIFFNHEKKNTIEFMGRTFDGQLSFKNNGYPVRLISKGDLHISFTKRYPTNMAPIQFKLVHPNCWVDPISKIREIIKDLSGYVGEVFEQVELIDISVHFTNWAINDSVYNNIITNTNHLMSYKKGGIYSAIYIGTLKQEIPFLRLYNKSKYLRNKKEAPSPNEFYTSQPPFGKDVWNLEVSFHKGALKAFNIRTIDEVVNAIPSLWQYATTDFIVIRSDNSQEPCPEWKQLSAAINQKNCQRIFRKHSRKRNPNSTYRKSLIKKSIDSYWLLHKELTIDQIMDEIKSMYVKPD